MYIHPELAHTPDSFDYFMQLKGECFREQKGRRTLKVILGGQNYFIKQYTGAGWKEIIKNLLQLKWPILSAKNEWQAIQRLQELAIPTPTVMAYGSRGINPARLHSFLLMKELAPIVSLEDFCRDWKKQAPPFALKQKLIKQVAHISKTLHENGIHHRDFYICHFLLDTQDFSKIYLIDLHRAGMQPSLRMRWIIKDLAGLYFSSKDIGLTRRDLWRFMKAYRQQDLGDIIRQEADFWKKIITRGDKLYAAHAVSTK